MGVCDRCDMGVRVLILLGYVVGVVGGWWGGVNGGEFGRLIGTKPLKMLRLVLACWKTVPALPNS